MSGVVLTFISSIRNSSRITGNSRQAVQSFEMESRNTLDCRLKPDVRVAEIY